MRRRARTDANQSSIVDALRQIPGVSVEIINDAFDILVGFKKVSYVIELKDGAKSASRKKLRPRQEKFRDTWTGQWDKCENLNDVLKVIGIKN